MEIVNPSFPLQYSSWTNSAFTFRPRSFRAFEISRCFSWRCSCSRRCESSMSSTDISCSGRFFSFSRSYGKSNFRRETSSTNRTRWIGIGFRFTYNFPKQHNIFTSNDEYAARNVAVLGANVYSFDGLVQHQIRKLIHASQITNQRSAISQQHHQFLCQMGRKI